MEDELDAILSQFDERELTALLLEGTSSNGLHPFELPFQRGKRKQLITVGNGTGVGLIILWEEHIGVLDEGVIYLLIGFLMRDYSCKKYFSMARDGYSMIICEDIGDVKVSMLKMRMMSPGFVMQRWLLDSYKSCLL